MTERMFKAIETYYNNQTGRNREVGMDLICSGHLDPMEVKRLKWAIDRYYERMAKGT